MKQLKIYFKSLFISSVIVFNLLLLIFGIGTAYCNMRALAYGEYVKAAEFTENGIRILDFEINFKKPPAMQVASC